MKEPPAKGVYVAARPGGRVSAPKGKHFKDPSTREESSAAKTDLADRQSGANANPHPSEPGRQTTQAAVEKSPELKVARPSQPTFPAGFKSNREFGEFMKWPTPQNPSGGPMPSADELRRRGITRQDIQRWQEFYEGVSLHNSGNPSADPRAGYLSKMKNLLD